ncbi:MAG: GNAT family N-acetyltransferase [Spirochaetes bacterium]|nr:GNAT family N-acetyltransferase [Spirochaetota bacterium]MBN2769722.1 GNAT family N-acetyltransferase [Spirochaetota bacterium]
MKNNNTHIIKKCSNNTDRRKLIDFNSMIHGEDCGRLTEKLLKKHPQIHDENFIFIQNSKNEIISSVALIPWQVDFHNIKLNVFELGIVGTDPKERGKGLSRELTNYFIDMIEDLKYDMSIIQGVPGFYHNFGFHYAIPLDIHLNLPCYLSSQIKKHDGYVIKKALPSSSLTISDMFNAHVSNYDLHPVMDAETVSYCMDCSSDSEYDAEYFMVNYNGKEEGYFKINLHGFGAGLIVSEVSDMNYSAYMHIIAYCSKLAKERTMGYIRFNLPDFHPVYRIADNLGAICDQKYAWQIKIDTVRFLNKISPVLETRLQGAFFEKESFTLKINLYRYYLEIDITKGKIMSIIRKPHSGEFDDSFAIKEADFYSLITGYESVDEIDKRAHDFFISGYNRSIADVLFPKQKTFLYYNM